MTTPKDASRGWLPRLLVVAAAVTLYYLIQWLTGVLAIYPHLGLPEEMVQRGSWIRAVDHHVWQMILALVAIGVLSRGGWREWGLNLRNRDESIRIIRKFTYYYVVWFVGIGFLLQWIGNVTPRMAELPSTFQITGRLLFGFLLVGLSEEILFRGLIHTWLGRYWRKVWVWRTMKLPVAGVIATLIFTIAHIGVTVSPFAITHLQPLQLVQAFVLGIFYSWAYHRTSSLLAPIVAHNISDGALWAAEYLLVWVRS